MPDLDKIYKSKLDHSHGEGLQAVYQAGVDAGKAEVAAQSPPPGSTDDVDDKDAEVEQEPVPEGKKTKAAKAQDG
jgi:hypothetical protein